MIQPAPRVATSAADGATTATAGDDALPTWNLRDLYDGTDDPALRSDLDAAEEAADALAGKVEGRLAELDGDELAAAIGEYELILEKIYRVMSYAQLLRAGNVSDAAIAKFFQGCQERVTDISSKTLFLGLELNRVPDETIERQLADPALAAYRPWVEECRKFRPYQLSDELEKMLHEKSVAGRSAWVRLFDETMASLRFDVTQIGTGLTLDRVLNLLSDTNGLKRKAAARSLGFKLAEHASTLALIHNTLAKDKAIEDRWRSYPQPMSSRNLSNQVEDEVVEALVAAVKDSYPRLSHRYYQLKAKWFGVPELDYWDRNAPLSQDADRRYSWEEARKTVLGAYSGFAPEMADIAGRFFDRGWIDAPPRDGKQSGAFAHPTVPSAHPFVLLNFHGKTRDVMTLAHELGHGVHQVLAAPKGLLLADTPLTLAETASVFGEMLTFRAILDAEQDPKRRRALLAGKVEDMLNTVVRQIAFHEFERRLHDARRDGELAVDEINEIWMETQRESLGPAFRFSDEYASYWGYIPHFVHTPFYVYAYAFGDCLVNALYGVFQDGHPGFQEKYFEMLKSGGSKRHDELLAPFGLDASDPAFWKRGLDVISGFVDELEADA